MLVANINDHHTRANMIFHFGSHSFSSVS
jgi:hypothetical protein